MARSGIEFENLVKIMHRIKMTNDSLERRMSETKKLVITYVGYSMVLRGSRCLNQNNGIKLLEN